MCSYLQSGLTAPTFGDLQGGARDGSGMGTSTSSQVTGAAGGSLFTFGTAGAAPPSGILGSQQQQQPQQQQAGGPVFMSYAAVTSAAVAPGAGVPAVVAGVPIGSGAALAVVLSVLAPLAEAVWHISQYRCAEGIEALSK